MSRICIFRGVCPGYYNIAKGGGGEGFFQFITILHRVQGSLGTPNLYYIINGRRLIEKENYIDD